MADLQLILDKYRPKSRGPVYDPIAAVFDRVLLGPGYHLTPNLIRTQNITHIVNCAERSACPAWAETHVGPSRFTCLDAEDTTEYHILRDIYPLFESTMDTYLRDPQCKCVYVHCVAGMNRSATLLAAYINHRFGVPMEKVVDVMARQRPCIMTNTFFLQQLAEFGSHRKNK